MYIYIYIHYRPTSCFFYYQGSWRAAWLIIVLLEFQWYWGGYKFPWLGLWCQEAVVLKQNELPGRAWSRWRMPRQASWKRWKSQKDVFNLWQSTGWEKAFLPRRRLYKLRKEHGMTGYDERPRPKLFFLCIACFDIGLAGKWICIPMPGIQWYSLHLKVSLVARHMKNCSVCGVVGNLDLRRGWILHWMASDPTREMAMKHERVSCPTFHGPASTIEFAPRRYATMEILNHSPLPTRKNAKQ